MLGVGEGLHAANIAATPRQRVDNRVHGLAVRVQRLTVGHQVGVLANLVQPAIVEPIVYIILCVCLFKVYRISNEKINNISLLHCCNKVQFCLCLY